MVFLISAIRALISLASPAPSTMTVLSLVTLIWRAVPRSVICVSGRFMLSSEEI